MTFFRRINAATADTKPAFSAFITANSCVAPVWGRGLKQGGKGCVVQRLGAGIETETPSVCLKELCRPRLGAGIETLAFVSAFAALCRPRLGAGIETT